eukprot:jgi/Tetstr1/453585/TSEL_003980.t1
MKDATPSQLDFMATELQRFERIGAWVKLTHQPKRDMEWRTSHAAKAMWTAKTTRDPRDMLGTDLIGTTALDMRTGSLSPRTYNNYGSGTRTFPAF